MAEIKRVELLSGAAGSFLIFLETLRGEGMP
jgi:hypothetical protein